MAALKLAFGNGDDSHEDGITIEINPDDGDADDGDDPKPTVVTIVFNKPKPVKSERGLHLVKKTAFSPYDDREEVGAEWHARMNC